MTVVDQLKLIALFVLAMTVIVDLIALPLGFADRRGYTAPLKAVKRYMSNLLGFIFLGICVPGVIITAMVCFLRSWDDNNIVYVMLMLFLSGAVLGLFLSSEPVDVRESRA